ncbi:MAG: hypothetical protein PHF88_02190 [Candidatus Pacebacteria bacterium]|nr:hypothetical protein [Candidatus Paceibacterota bacterium]
MEEILLDRVLSRMMNELEGEDAIKVNNLLEKDLQEEVSSFFYERFPNMNDFFEEEIKNIQEEILNKYSKNN